MASEPSLAPRAGPSGLRLSASETSSPENVASYVMAQGRQCLTPEGRRARSTSLRWITTDPSAWHPAGLKASLARHLPRRPQRGHPDASCLTHSLGAGPKLGLGNALGKVDRESDSTYPR